MTGRRGPDAARDRILEDMRQFIDLGALDRATDLMIVLALYLRETSRRDRRLALATTRQRDAISLQRWRGSGQNGHAPQKGRGLPAMGAAPSEPAGAARDPLPSVADGDSGDGDPPS